MQAEIAGERKPVTILFTDIVGSTTIAERLDPEEWREVVTGAHRIVGEAVRRYKGTIAQLLGDGVMAFFGAPTSHEDDPERAVRAGLDIQRCLQDYRRELIGIAEDFQMRIGIHSGTVVVGQVDDGQHMEYLAIGDAVNLAARLQGAAPPGSVLISRVVARRVEKAIQLVDRGEIQLKGISKPIQVYEAVALMQEPDLARGLAGLHSPFVGREYELAAIQEGLESLEKGLGWIVGIFGEAGIGKSRLVQEAHHFAKQNPNQAGSRWLEGRALSYGENLSFWTIAQLIRTDLGLADGDLDIKTKAALRRRCRTLFGGQQDEVLPYLAHLLGVKPDPEWEMVLRSLEGETLKRQIILSIQRYFETIAQEQPLVLVFEDLHWVDPSSLEALTSLLHVTDQVPLLLILVARPERAHGSWNLRLQILTDFEHRYTEINLKPFQREQENMMFDYLLNCANLPKVLRERCLERSEGNPFYLEEVIQSLIERGGLIQKNGQWAVGQNIDSITIPETIQDVLLARIDHLQEDVRQTIQLAAVIGRSFLYRILKTISDAETQIDKHLALLQRVDLVREKTRHPDLEYIFKHSLTQEAAYNSLLIERRKEFHRRVGEALEQLFADRQEQFLGLLAHHFEAAGDQGKAIDYLTKAGDQARMSDEHTEAIGYYQRAIKLLEETKNDGLASQVWLKLGLIYNANFQFEESHQAYENAFRLKQKVGLPDFQQAGKDLKAMKTCLREPLQTLDPGKAAWRSDLQVIPQIFRGLARIDVEMNVTPEIARSWQILEGGMKYIFHLRDDFRWSDGSPVTANDFEWAWKRNINPITDAPYVQMLYDILGAREYHQGIDPNPDHVGVHAVDPVTLEVFLSNPVAYFPFIAAMPIAYPLHRSTIEQFGEEWWKPGKIVSNGPFQFGYYDPQGIYYMERALGYPVFTAGNLNRIEWKVIVDPKERAQAYIENQLDISQVFSTDFPEGITPAERLFAEELETTYLHLFSTASPLNDIRVRKALAYAIDRHKIIEKNPTNTAMGGLVPPGMPGYSPDLGLPYNVELGRKLLAEAGYPGGQGFPGLSAYVHRGHYPLVPTEVQRMWRENLGIEVSFQIADSWDWEDWTGMLERGPVIIGWMADYPDPDDFLRQSPILGLLDHFGWKEARQAIQLLEEAARTRERSQRMAIYRKVDRILVNEHAVIVPLAYGFEDAIYLIKPWVKNFWPNRMEYQFFEDIYLEDH